MPKQPWVQPRGPNTRAVRALKPFDVLFVVLFQKFKTPYYETKAICMSGVSDYERQEQIENLSQRTAIDLVNHLQINIENKDIKQLAKKLGVKESIASSIKKIEAEQLYQQDMEEKYYALTMQGIHFFILMMVLISEKNSINNLRKLTICSAPMEKDELNMLMLN